jgi:two-component system, chemotaxis family, chemotaxis protein CheY
MVNSLNFLLIDDHMLMRKLITKQLSGLGYERVDEAASAMLAMEQIGKKKSDGSEYDVIFVDWNMPSVNGLEFIKQYKDTYKDEPAFVMLTGECEKSSMIYALENGVTSYIIKPVSEDSLREKLDGVITWIKDKQSSGTLSQTPKEA